jgi:hypothetical protein
MMPAASIGDFLFPPRDIDDGKKYKASTIGMSWPTDAVMTERYVRDCTARGENCKRNKLFEMLDLLVNNHDGDLLALALERYHIQRPKAYLTSSAVEQRCQAVPPQALRFLRTILDKTYHNLAPQRTTGATPTITGVAAGRASLGPLAQRMVACRICWASPRGVEGVIRHVREQHPAVFYNNIDWDIVR